VTLRGRVTSLLEVGTGFHPELSGRENVYLNGAILGMNRGEIRKKFDEIVAFAEVEKFLDTPVKRYSSGMYMRLAFAVAAHLEPEILIVDEVLAVGDSEFQKKCLGKMSEVAGSGRTILFVSHNMAAIEGLCNSAILLAEGHCIAQGATRTIIQKYHRRQKTSHDLNLGQRTDREGSGSIRFVSVRLEGQTEQELSAFRCGEDAIIRIDFDNLMKQEVRSVDMSIGIDNDMGQRVALLDSEMIGANILPLKIGRNSVKFTIRKMPLAPGRFGLSLFISINGIVADWIRDAGVMDIESGDFYGTGRLLGRDLGQGLFLIDHDLQTIDDKNAEIQAGLEISRANNLSGRQ
jgi:lipopolysaccharide transport system ATP-binding protein